MAIYARNIFNMKTSIKVCQDNDQHSKFKNVFGGTFKLNINCIKFSKCLPCSLVHARLQSLMKVLTSEQPLQLVYDASRSRSSAVRFDRISSSLSSVVDCLLSTLWCRASSIPHVIMKRIKIRRVSWPLVLRPLKRY
jgi:hypothetical protein